MAHQYDTQLLPESILELIDVVGLQAALAIVEERGGVRLFVPKIYKPDHWLCKLIGTDPAAKLIAYYGGEEIEISRCAAALNAVKEHQIANSDASNSELARQYGYTERGIRKLRRRVEERDGINANQIGLFD